MTKNRANPQRSYLPGSTSSPAVSECPTLSGNVRRIENSSFPHRQHDVLPVMASAPSWAFAVRVCETGKLRKDIQDLEDAVALCNAQHPVK